MPATRKRNKRKKGRSLKSAMYYRRMAHIGMMKEDFRGAADNYRMALMVDPKDFDSASNLGNIFSLMGDFDNSLEYYLKARELGDTTVDTAYGLVSVYQIKGEYTKALELLDTMKPEGELTETDIIQARAMCYTKLHNFEEADKNIEILKKEGIDQEVLDELNSELKNEKELFEVSEKNKEKVEKAVKTKAPAKKKSEKETKEPTKKAVAKQSVAKKEAAAKKE